jgi:hypothetical protein
VSSAGEPRGSVIWNAQKHRYDWSAFVGGRTITGHATTDADAREEMSWRVSGGQPLRVGRIPRGVIPRDPR